MRQAKRRIWAGVICEQVVYNLPDKARNIKDSQPQKPRFDSEEELHEAINYILNSDVCCQIVSDCENRLETLKGKIHSLRQKLEYLDRETDRLFVSYTEGSLNSSAFKQQHTIIKEERNNTEKWLDQIVTERKKTEQNYYSM